MEKIEVVCVKSHTYDYVQRNPGEVFYIKRRHFQVLAALKRVRPAVEADSGEGVVVPMVVLSPKIDTAARPVTQADNAGNVADDSAEAVKRSLRAEYKALFGKDAHGRTSVEKLRDEIEKKRAETHD